MKISFAATNPCHLFELAVAVFQIGKIGHFYSGYPGWKLSPPEGFPLKSKSKRTLFTYAMQRIPERLRVPSHILFSWQDRGFDREVATILEQANYIHGLPGQCLEIFRKCRELGIVTVLNHASGPLDQQMQLLESEYQRAGVQSLSTSRSSKELLYRIDAELQLADYHCVASTVVKDQLVRAGVAPQTIWIIPYGANVERFKKREQCPQDSTFRICFAGLASLRKGLFYLLQALEQAGERQWELHCYGAGSLETEGDFRNYQGRIGIYRHGAVSQDQLGRALKVVSVLVLPSVEEAFGLVVVQALQVGVPCIVSDRVGAKDLIEHRKNGSIVPFGDSVALLEELEWWSAHPTTVEQHYGWKEPAEALIQKSGEFLK